MRTWGQAESCLHERKVEVILVTEVLSKVAGVKNWSSVKCWVELWGVERTLIWTCPVWGGHKQSSDNFLIGQTFLGFPTGQNKVRVSVSPSVSELLLSEFFFSLNVLPRPARNVDIKPISAHKKAILPRRFNFLLLLGMFGVWLEISS